MPSTASPKAKRKPTADAGQTSTHPPGIFTSLSSKHGEKASPVISLTEHMEQMQHLVVETGEKTRLLLLSPEWKSIQGAHEIAKAAVIAQSVGTMLASLADSIMQSERASAPRDKVQETFEQLVASGELLETAAFLQSVKWSRQALSKAVLTHRLFYVEVGGVRAYPAFYLDHRYNRKDLEAVSKALGDLSGGSKWLFFTTPKASLSLPAPGSATERARAHAGQEALSPRMKGLNLGETGVPRTPLQALEAGDLARVTRAALAYAER